MKLYCIPCAGSSAIMYMRWKRLFSHNVEIIPIELAGRGSRITDEHICDFNHQIDDIYNKYFVNHTSSDKFYIFGHSMGALLAYGVAHKLYKSNETLPLAIIVSASSAPSCKDKEKFQKLDDQSLIDELKEHGGTSEIVFEHNELLDMTLQCLRADYQTCNSYDYIYKGRLPFPIHVFHGMDDKMELYELKAWKNETNFPISLTTFEGGHFFIQPDKSESLVINKLNDILSTHE